MARAFFAKSCACFTFASFWTEPWPSWAVTYCLAASSGYNLLKILGVATLAFTGDLESCYSCFMGALAACVIVLIGAESDALLTWAVD